MANNREISQFAGLVTVNDTTNNVSLGSTLELSGSSNLGIGIANPTEKLVLAANNTSTASNNKLRFQDIDPTAVNGQKLGRIEWYTSDLDEPGVKAYIEATGYVDGRGGILTLGTDGSGGSAQGIVFTKQGSTIAQIDSSGYLRLESGGIQFNGDTAAANALDDYEEGTWTPVLSVNGTDSTSTISLTGHYRKIGSMIWLSILAQQANTVPLNWNVGWTSITGSPFSRRFALIGAHGLGNLSAGFPLIQTYWTGGQSQADGSIKIRSSANTSGADNYYQTVFTFGSVNY